MVIWKVMRSCRHHFQSPSRPSRQRQLDHVDSNQRWCTGINYDFCELLPSDISGHVYVDRNNNGVRETGENPIAGVTLILWNASNTEVGRTTTDGNGFYKFDNVVPGNYRITEQQPTGYLPGKAAAGTINSIKVGTTDATGNLIAQVAVPSGVSGIDYDFGEILRAGSLVALSLIPMATVSSMPSLKKPLSGVRIELLDATGSVLQTTFTDANGNYRFDNLIPGVFSVREHSRLATSKVVNMR